MFMRNAVFFCLDRIDCRDVHESALKACAEDGPTRAEMEQFHDESTKRILSVPSEKLRAAAEPFRSISDSEYARLRSVVRQEFAKVARLHLPSTPQPNRPAALPRLMVELSPPLVERTGDQPVA